MLRKKWIVISCIVILVICALTGISLATPGFKLPQLFISSKLSDTADAVFERNGEILYFDGKNEKISVLSAERKYSPVLSPDNSKILYRKSVLEQQDHSMVFGAIDLSGKVLFEIKVDTEFSNDILNISWISDSLVGVTTHINPSSSEYFVYDINTQKMVKNYVGNLFTVIPGTDLIMYQKNVPHWSDEPVQASFIIEDTTVYESKNVNSKLEAPVFSPDLTKVAFIETVTDSGQNSPISSIVVCDFNLSALSLSEKERITIDSAISGYIAFNEKNEACIVNADTVYRYNKDTSSFAKEKVSTSLRNNATDSAKYSELQKAITALYGDSNLDNILYINWITK